MQRVEINCISGQAPVELAMRLADAARFEQRTASQLVVSAVDLYTRLSPEVHVALRRIAATEGEAVVQQLMTDIGRRILDRQFDVARRKVAEQMNTAALGALTSDDELLNAASAAVSHRYPKPVRRKRG